MMDDCTLRTWAMRERCRGQNACRAEFLPIDWRPELSLPVEAPWVNALRPAEAQGLASPAEGNVASVFRRLRTSFLVLGRGEVYTPLRPIQLALRIFRRGTGLQCWGCPLPIRCPLVLTPARLRLLARRGRATIPPFKWTEDKSAPSSQESSDLLAPIALRFANASVLSG